LLTAAACVDLWGNQYSLIVPTTIQNRENRVIRAKKKSNMPIAKQASNSQSHEIQTTQ